MSPFRGIGEWGGDPFTQGRAPGLNYYDGTGVSQNKEEAKKWLRKAANQGYENAKQYLKKCFGEE